MYNIVTTCANMRNKYSTSVSQFQAGIEIMLLEEIATGIREILGFQNKNNKNYTHHIFIHKV